MYEKVEYAALYKAQSELVTRRAKGENITNWTPDYLSDLDDVIKQVFVLLKQDYIEGERAGLYEYTIPESIKIIIQQFDKKGVYIPFEVVDMWKESYSLAYNGDVNATMLFPMVTEKMWTLEANGIIPEDLVEKFSSIEIAKELQRSAVSDKETSGNETSGPYQDIFNPFYRERNDSGKSTDPVVALENALYYLDKEFKDRKDIIDFVPPDFINDLKDSDLTPEEYDRYMEAYLKLRARYVRYWVIKSVLNPRIEPVISWYAPDQKLKPAFEIVEKAGKMTASRFEMMQGWVRAIQAHVNQIQSWDDAFNPPTLRSDLASTKPNEALFRHAYSELKRLIAASLQRVR